MNDDTMISITGIDEKQAVQGRIQAGRDIRHAFAQLEAILNDELLRETYPHAAGALEVVRAALTKSTEGGTR